jgi:uncharacterized caspase-like protein
MRVIVGHFIALMLLGCALGHAQAASIHALVIGIDEYDGNDRLEGAVADANDITQALSRLSPKSLVTLRNRDASRARILAGLNAMASSAKPGDVVIFTYAGHGGREPWRAQNGQLEKAETFLLSGFNPRGGKFTEKILDKEMNAWLGRMAATQAKVVFVADSCHAGGMTRDFHPLAGRLTVRSAPYALPDSLVTSADLQRSNASLATMPHVTFLAATQEEKLTPEVLIDGKKRGALSYAFARALGGSADPDRNGVLTYLGLARFVTAQVRQLSEARQTPEVIYRSGGDGDTVLSGIPKAPVEATAAPLRVKLLNASSDAASSLRQVQIVRDDTASLVWDAKPQSVISSLGDPVAEKISLAAFQGVIDKWRALDELKQLAVARPLKLDLKPGNQSHVAGATVSFYSAPLTFKHVTAINLAADGSIQYLFPLPEDPKEHRIGTPYTLSTRVRDPFGADHLLVVATQHPVTTLRTHLIRGMPVSKLPEFIRDATGSNGFQLGILGLYTHKGP